MLSRPTFWWLPVLPFDETLAPRGACGIWPVAGLTRRFTAQIVLRNSIRQHAPARNIASRCLEDVNFAVLSQPKRSAGGRAISNVRSEMDDSLQAFLPRCPDPFGG
jgi:hypothetical protein